MRRGANPSDYKEAVPAALTPDRGGSPLAPVPLVLASASPRRLELLRALGLDVRVMPASLDETPEPDETARAHVLRLAAAKADAVRVRLGGAPALVLAADTTVTLGGKLLGKPLGPGEALAMLRELAGRTHEVWTSCALTRADSALSASCVASARVRFRPWDEGLARWYVGTGEPFDKAGAYGLQGRGVLLTEGIEGSWSAVVGLPLEELPALFRAVGDDLLARSMERDSRG
jgi:nucleoside triphosphate pyrophosphatase